MAGFPEPLKRLIDEFERLPGIGAKTAERLAFAVLRGRPEEAAAFADTLVEAKRRVTSCATCSNVATSERCDVCSDPGRDAGLVLVVEHPRDVVAFERTGRWKGTYHVLLGRLSPHEGAGTEALSLKALEARVARGGLREVVLGTNPDAEGDATALTIEGRLGGKVAVSRLARGLSSGGAIEYAGTEVLAEALRLRRPAVGGG